MILHDFNTGWGDNIELRRFEKSIIEQYLASWKLDSVRSVIINSTWYNQDYHSQVIEYIVQNAIERIAVMSMLDPAIPNHEWFADVDAEVHFVGYYPGPDEIDCWALIVDRYFNFHSIIKHDTITKPFLCYNRKPHWHRKQFFQSLCSLGVDKVGIVTMGDPSGRAVAKIDQDVEPSYIAPNPGPEQYGIVNDIMSLGPMSNWNCCFLNVVTETVFDIDKQWFVSEKIYKPIIGLRPFLVYAPNGAQNWLAHVGVESFVDDFKDISDLDLKVPSNLPAFLQKLNECPQSYWQSKYLLLEPKILRNRRALAEYINRLKNKIIKGIPT